MQKSKKQSPRIKDITLYNDIEQGLLDFDYHIPMPGIKKADNLTCFVLQLIDSIRRIEYVKVISNKSYTKSIINANNTSFNPLKASSYFYSQNDIDEAIWLIFLFVHFGKNANSGWNLLRSVYSMLNSGKTLSWQTISANPNAFEKWLSQNYAQVKASGNFGNHRKYESLRTDSPSGTASVFESYIKWVGTFGSHSMMLQQALTASGSDPVATFSYLYKSMNKVLRFGRTAKFDYLTMIGKLGIANLIPGSAYMSEATGPLNGGKLLFNGSITGSITAQKIESNLSELINYLGLYFGMQVLEDALCNWQKSPDSYVYFKG